MKRIVAIALGAIVWCGGCAPRSAAPLLPAAPARIAGVTAVLHLYVTDRGGAILRYAVDPVTGVPQGTPDATIAGLHDARGIAIGPNGDVYAVDAAQRSVAIFAPAPGSASKPERSLSIGHRRGIGAVAVDADGYAYVAWSAVCTTEGFVCGYADVYSPLAKGLKKIATLSFGGGPGGGVVRSIAATGAQTIAVQLGSQSPEIYSAARSNPSAYMLFCGAENPSGLAWGAAHTIYETDLGGTQPVTPAQVVVVPNYLHGNINNCPAFRTTYPAGFALHNPKAIAARNGVLYVTSAARIFVLRASSTGAQKALAVIGGAASQLHDPRGIAIGP